MFISSFIDSLCYFSSISYFKVLFVSFGKTGEAVFLGFQHYILALGTAVMIPSFLVPYMGGTDVSSFFIKDQYFFLSKKLI